MRVLGQWHEGEQLEGLVLSARLVVVLSVSLQYLGSCLTLVQPQ